MNKTAAVLTLFLLINRSSASAGVGRGTGRARRGSLAVAGRVDPEVIAAKSGPLPPGPLTILIYKDGRQLQVQNYAVLGKTLTVFSDQTNLKIPLADLDIPATRKLNGGHGVDFAVPELP